MTAPLGIVSSYLGVADRSSRSWLYSCFGFVRKGSAGSALAARDLRIGQGGHYVRPQNPGLDALLIDHYENLAGVAIMLAARFPANITPLNPEVLATLSIKSAHELDDGRDGISYLLDAKRNGIVTPLSGRYEREILRRMKTRSLDDALKKIRGG